MTTGITREEQIAYLEHRWEELENNIWSQRTQRNRLRVWREMLIDSMEAVYAETVLMELENGIEQDEAEQRVVENALIDLAAPGWVST